MTIIFKGFFDILNSWWMLAAFMIIPLGWVTAALTALPSVIGVLGSLFGKKKQPTQYTSGLSAQDQQWRNWLQGQIKGMAGSYKRNVPQIPKSYLNAQALLYKKFGLGTPPTYTSKSYAFGGIAGYPQTARLAERGPEAIIPLGQYGQRQAYNPWRMGGGMGQPGGLGGGLGAINFAPLQNTLPMNRGPYPTPMSTTPGGLGAINFAPSQITVPTTPPNIESRQRQILPPPGYQIPTTTPPGIPPTVWGELRLPPGPTGQPTGMSGMGGLISPREPLTLPTPLSQGWTGSTQLISPTSTAPSAFGGMPRIQNPWARLLSRTR